MKPAEVVLVGAGTRGTHTYGDYAQRFPHKLRYVAVAEPDEDRRQAFAERHGIPPERRFVSWEDIAARKQVAEAAFIVTLDRLHFAPAVALLRQGYHVIVEKPMAVDPVECAAMVMASERFGRVLSIGHVLRFTPFYTEVASALRAGSLGEVVNVNQTECVGQWHFAQSFVRGNWANAAASAPSILAKCCHDLDIIRWLVGAPVRRLASFGNLFEFHREKAPGPTPDRCTDGCPHEAQCPHSAYKHYLEPARFWVATLPKREHPEPSGRLEWLRSSPYSRCVYRLDNDVCDQQIVMMEFESGATATLTMMAHTRDDTRTLRISGTRGELHGHLVRNDIRIRDFITDKQMRITPEVIESGHMGGDIILIDRFLESIRKPGVDHLSSARESLESHLMAFAAEQSRMEGRFVEMKEFARGIEEIVRQRFPELT